MTSIAIRRFLSGVSIGQSSVADYLEARGKGEQGDVARLLDRQAEAALMPGAYARQTARNDLAALGDEALQQTNVAVGDRVDLLGAELANLLAPEELTAARTAAGSAGRAWCARSASTTGAPSVCVLLVV